MQRLEYAFLHIVEWDRTIVHRTHVARSSENLTSTGNDKGYIYIGKLP